MKRGSTGSNSSKIKELRRTIFTVCLIFFFLAISQFNPISHLISTLNSTSRKTEVLLILHGAPYIAPVRPLPKSFSDPVLQGNWGDWLWKLAVQRLLDPDRSITCSHKREYCVQQNPNVSRIVHYYPSANNLMEEWRLKGRLVNKHILTAQNILLNHEDDIVLPIGLGTQAEFSKNRFQGDLGLQSNFTLSSKDAVLDTMSILFLKEMERRGQVSFFRGSFTNEVAMKYGYYHGIEAGCPTLFINDDSNLGKDLERKYNLVINRIGDRSLKIAFNSSPARPRLTKLIVNLSNVYPNSLIFAQEKGEMKHLESVGVPFQKIRLFEGNIIAWQHELRKMDIAFGPRIHGNMAAISASVPAYVVAPDHRVYELSNVMKLPHTHIYDERLLNSSLDIAEIIQSAKFDGSSFDLNRCNIAKMYVRGFGSIGMHISNHVKDLAMQC